MKENKTIGHTRDENGEMNLLRTRKYDMYRNAHMINKECQLDGSQIMFTEE